MESKDTADVHRPISPAAEYREHLRVPWNWWMIGAIAAALMCYEIHLAGRGAVWEIPVFVLIAIFAVLVLWSMGRATVGVRDGEVWAGNAHLPIGLISRAAAVPAEAKSAAMGRQLDPAAFVYHKGWIKTMVVLVLDDPDDPTPYWMLSTRHPDKILAAIPTATTLGD